MGLRKEFKREREFLRYESVLEVTSWWVLLTISWAIKWFYSETAALPFAYLIILSLAMSTLLLFRLLPPQLLQQRKIYIWCLIFLVSVLVFEHFTGGAESPFWFLYLLPLFVSTIAFENLAVPFSLLLISIFFIFAHAVWVNEVFSPPILKHCLIKVFGLTVFTAFAHFLNKEAIKIKSELLRAYGALRGKQNEIEKINTELKIQKETLLETANELQRANEYLKRLSKIKSDFVSVVSHELRTPLTSIKESISLVLDGDTGSLNTEQLKFIRIAEKNAERLSNLIDNILDFSKLESGAAIAHRRSMNITSIINNVYETLYPAIKDKSIQVRLELSPDLPEVWVDADKINQVLTNILGNAIKFSLLGSNIWIRSRPTIIEGREQVEVSIRDTGPGIAEEDLPKLFIQFSQLDSPLTRKSGGTGLGLAISKNIVELHGGIIGVESELGKGSEFYFRLPVYRKDIELNFIIDEQINKFKTHHTSFSLILMRLKNYEALKQTLLKREIESIAQRLEELVKRTVRGPEDRISRYCEGEFIAVIAGTNRDGATKIVERIKEAADKEEFIPDVTPLELSFGIAVYPDEANSKEEMLLKAEEVK